MKRSNWPTTSRQSRGYGQDWQILRKTILERDGHVCQCTYCKADGDTKIATEVNHIKPKARGGTDEPGNLQAVNAECHKRLTLEQFGATYKPRVIIGLDGFPIDRALDRAPRRPGGE